jgi:hypothetical protein
MKVEASQIAMQAGHHRFERRESEETLRAWRGERPNFEQSPAITADISAAARRALAAAPSPQPNLPTSSSNCCETAAIESAAEAADHDPFILILKRMIEWLTGEEVRVFDLRSFSAEMRQTEVQAASTSASLQATNSGRAGWGVEYDYHAVREEFEQTRFTAEGIIRTEDGQEIRFSLSLEMTRSYREETHVSLRAGDAVRKDPLVINFGGTTAQLAAHAGQHFRFDLDGDGRAELLPLFASGSGYLALDLNANGRIDSGKELFGPQSGNGFAELARLDADGNGWIDENDPAFERLQVYSPATEGDGKLRSLAELGIGALGLAHIATPFALRGDANADLGAVKASGVYLDTSGKAGSMQEIDLTV